MSSPRAVVIGQLARDLVLQVDRWPEVGHTADVHGRREMLADDEAKAPGSTIRRGAERGFGSTGQFGGLW